MAMPSYKITKTEFREQYNVVGILTDKAEIMKQLQTFNPKNQAVAFGYKKKPGDDAPKWFKEFETRLDKRLTNIETRLDKHDEMFKQHGWM